MELKDESIRLLKKRMHHQMSVSSEEESEAYEEIPSDIEYIKKLEEIPPAIKDIKVPETMEARHERAKNEYEKVLQAVDEEEIFGFRKPHWLNIKG